MDIGNDLKRVYWDGFEDGKKAVAEWISVDERLPDGNGKFLVVDEEGYIITASFYPSHGWFMHICNGTPVTHWMPLPTPPKEDKND